MPAAVEIRGALQPFEPRLVIPSDDNLYYIRRASGGYNPGIKGHPQHKSLDALANCVSYALGRFNEIGDYGECRYLKPVNAERFIEYAGGLEISQKPALGACAVWQGGSSLDGSDGAGHVAIVEQVFSDGSIMTSESGYGASRPFWITHRQKGSGRWGQGASYKFLGFILHPAVTELPRGLEWVTLCVKRGDGSREYIQVPGALIGSRWHVQLRSLDEPLGLAKVGYDAEAGTPEVYIE